MKEKRMVVGAAIVGAGVGIGAYCAIKGCGKGNNYTVTENNTVNNIDNSINNYGDTRTVQEATNVAISRAIVNVAMENVNKCKVNANVTQRIVASMSNCEVAGDVRVGNTANVAVSFQCMVRSSMSGQALSDFVNKVKARAKQVVEQDTSSDRAIPATVNRTFSKIINESVTESMMKNVFEAATTLNQKQEVISNFSKCKIGGKLDIENTLQFKLTQFVSNQTKTTFKNMSQSFNQLESDLTQSVKQKNET